MRRDTTQAERKLWYEFLANLEDKFTRQKPLGPYIADFYCAERQPIIEIDGDSHFTSRGQAYDINRTRALASRGLRVLRFTNAEVLQEFEAVCQRIEDALRVPEE